MFHQYYSSSLHQHQFIVQLQMKYSYQRSAGQQKFCPRQHPRPADKLKCRPPPSRPASSHTTTAPPREMHSSRDDFSKKLNKSHQKLLAKHVHRFQHHLMEKMILK